MKHRIGLVLATLALVSGCGGGSDDAVPPGPEAGIVPSPSPVPPNQGPSQGLWVTFDVVGETFRAVVTSPTAIQYLVDFSMNRADQRIPSGALLRGGQFNSPWSWRMDPATVEFADATIELCDARPSYVESHVDEFVDNVKRYCPWGAKIKAIQDCRDGSCARMQILRGSVPGPSPEPSPAP